MAGYREFVGAGTISDIAKVSAGVEVFENVRAARRRLVEGGPRAVRSEGASERVALPETPMPTACEISWRPSQRRPSLKSDWAAAPRPVATAEALVSNGAAGVRHVIIVSIQGSGVWASVGVG